MTLVRPTQEQAGPKVVLLSVREAQSRILERLELMPAETVPLADALGRVCAEDMQAKLNHPPGPVSAMDGYACRSDDVQTLPARLRIAGTSRAGEHFTGRLTGGSCIRVFTGATVPEGADVIALQEDVIAHDGAAEVLEVPRPGQFIRRAGLDFAAGQVCVETGRALTARDLGVLVASGHTHVGVRRRPRVAILSTGDELVLPGVDPKPHQIISSNGIALAAAVSGWGGLPIDLGIAADRIEAITAAIGRARDVDMLVTTGGASVGDHDLVQAALTRCGFVSSFWRIAMRPGKPLMFGRLGALPVLTMPGNPVSALVCALLFLRPALRNMLGISPAVPLFETAVLGEKMPANDQREDYVRGTIEQIGRDLVVHPFPVQDSSMLTILAKSTVLIRRPSHAPAADVGDGVDCIRLETQAEPF